MVVYRYLIIQCANDDAKALRGSVLRYAHQIVVFLVMVCGKSPLLSYCESTNQKQAVENIFAQIISTNYAIGDLPADYR